MMLKCDEERGDVYPMMDIENRSELDQSQDKTETLYEGGADPQEPLEEEKFTCPICYEEVEF